MNEIHEETLLDMKTDSTHKDSDREDKGNFRRKCFSQVKNLFTSISIGQYDKPLLLNNKSSESSAIGGILTLIAAVAFITFTVITSIGIFQRQRYTLDIQTKSIIIELTDSF
jgi:hypothetical protein